MIIVFLPGKNWDIFFSKLFVHKRTITITNGTSVQICILLHIKSSFVVVAHCFGSFISKIFSVNGEWIHMKTAPKLPILIVIHTCKPIVFFCNGGSISLRSFQHRLCYKNIRIIVFFLFWPLNVDSIWNVLGFADIWRHKTGDIFDRMNFDCDCTIIKSKKHLFCDRFEVSEFASKKHGTQVRVANDTFIGHAYSNQFNSYRRNAVSFQIINKHSCSFFHSFRVILFCRSINGCMLRRLVAVIVIHLHENRLGLCVVSFGWTKKMHFQ